jgi:hypothetical protein
LVSWRQGRWPLWSKLSLTMVVLKLGSSSMFCLTWAEYKYETFCIQVKGLGLLGDGNMWYMGAIVTLQKSGWSELGLSKCGIQYYEIKVNPTR